MKPRFPFSALAFLLLWGCSSHGGNLPETFRDVFEQANRAYLEQNYEEAGHLYRSILDFGVQDGVVEYNLGNTYFQMGDLGRAVLHYRRAIRLRPRDENLRHNLAVARTQLEDTSSRSNTIHLGETLSEIAHTLTVNEWTLFTSLLFNLAVGILVLRSFLNGAGMRRALRSVAAALAILTLWAGANTAWLLHREARPLAVVIQPNLPLYKTPSPDGEESLTLRAGMEVEILREIGGRVLLPEEGEGTRRGERWFEIRRAPNLHGFCRATGVERI